MCLGYGIVATGWGVPTKIPDIIRRVFDYSCLYVVMVPAEAPPLTSTHTLPVRFSQHGHISLDRLGLGLGFRNSIFSSSVLALEPCRILRVETKRRKPWR